MRVSELVVVSGPLLGTRFPLGPREVRIGRAPQLEIRLTDSGAAWEHCVIRPHDGGYRLTDRRSGTGTYVNGMRITEHCLEPGDHLGIGETVLVYQEEAPSPPATPRDTLLRACSLQFLFRALAMAQEDSQRSLLEDQILRLLADLVPIDGGAVFLATNGADLRTAAHQRALPHHLKQAISTALQEGGVLDTNASAAAFPLEVRGRIAGVLAAWFSPGEAAGLDEHYDTLGAIAALAIAALESVQDVERLQTENALLKERLGSKETGIVGESLAIHKLLQILGRVAPQDTSVLILGESGTGKELVARALHRLSPRVPKPFVAINCAALTETLLESELFGHEKGAFTGAVAQKKGKLEVAEGGTIFLDEIGELAPQLQAKLLRVLQQREFERVGGTRTYTLDVRIVAATNRDLSADVRRGVFREDLYHRLNVVALRVPPLRERPEDIPALARYFLDRASSRCGRQVTGISPEAESCLIAYSWPGNVRELENAIERAVVLGESEVLLPEDLPETMLDAAGGSEFAAGGAGAMQSSVAETKKRLILNAWREAGGDHNRTAEKLNIHPNSLRRLIRTLNLREVLE